MRLAGLGLCLVLSAAVALAGPLTDRGRIKWIRVIDGKQVEVTIGQGEAWRLNPNMSAQRAKLKYDLNRNRELEQQVKATKLGGSTRSVSSVPTDRTLQLLSEGDKDDVVVGQWSMSLKAWKKKNPALKVVAVLNGPSFGQRVSEPNGTVRPIPAERLPSAVIPRSFKFATMYV